MRPGFSLSKDFSDKTPEQVIKAKTEKWMQSKIIMLREINQMQKSKYFLFVKVNTEGKYKNCMDVASLGN